MSAVSKKLIPASRAASTTAAAPVASVRQPKLLHPIPTRDTSRHPSLRYSIVRDYIGNIEAVVSGIHDCGLGEGEGVPGIERGYGGNQDFMHIVRVSRSGDRILEDFKQVANPLRKINVHIGDVFACAVALKRELQISMTVESLEAADELEPRHRFMQCVVDGMKQG